MRAIIVLAILLASHAAAAPASGDLSFDARVRDVALSGTGDYVGVGTNDPKSGPLGDKDLPTWFLHETASPYNLRQDGGADPQSCSGLTGATQACESDVTFVAISHAGDRMVAASQSSSDKVEIVFIYRASGVKAHINVSGVIQGLAMDEGGNNVAAAFSRPDRISIDGQVRYWDDEGTEKWMKETTGAPTDLAMSRDGQRIMVSTGSSIQIFRDISSASVFTDDWGSRTVQALAFSGRSDHLAAAADDRGTIRIYADDGSKARRELNIPGGQTGADALAFSKDGSHLAIALDKTLRIWHVLDAPYRFDGIVLEEDQSATITSLQYVDDYLVVTSAREVAVYDAHALVRLWSATFPSDIAAASMDDAGDHLAVAFGSTVRLFTLADGATVTLTGTTTATPGSTHTLSVEVKNTGDRLLAGEVDVHAPAGIGYDDPGNISLLPGKSQTLALALDIPATWPAGELVIGVEVQGETAQKTLQVAQREAWSLTADGATSKAVDGSATFNVRVHNDGNVEGKPTLQTNISPSGWTLDVPALSTIPPGGESQLAIRMHAPANAANLARGVAHIGLNGQLPLELVGTVGANFQPALDVPGRIQLQSGEVTEIQATLRNAGNSPDSFDVAIKGVPTGWIVTFADGSTKQTLRNLDAGATRTLTINVEAPSGLTPITYVSTLEATSLGNSDKSTSAQLEFSPEEPKPEKKSPGPGPLLVVGLLAVALMRRR